MNAGSRVTSIYDLAVLTPDRVKSVYPLVRHHNDSIDFDTWCDFATPLIDGLAADRRPSTGIIVATRRGAARGMFVYMRLPHLGLGRVLLVPHAFCAELLRTTPLWALLLREMMTIAADLGCAMVRLVVHPPWGDLPMAVRQMGNELIPVELLLVDDQSGEFNN